MIHTRLVVFGREDGVAFAKVNVTPFAQAGELPADEAVVKGIDVGRDERTPPVGLIDQVWNSISRIVCGETWLTCNPSFMRSFLARGGK